MTLFLCHHSLKLQALTCHKKSMAWVWPFRSVCDDSWINLLICFGRLRVSAAPGSSLLLLIPSRLGKSHDTTTATQGGPFPLISTLQLNKAAFFSCRIIAKHIFYKKSIWDLHEKWRKGSCNQETSDWNWDTCKLCQHLTEMKYKWGK